MDIKARTATMVAPPIVERRVDESGTDKEVDFHQLAEEHLDASCRLASVDGHAVVRVARRPGRPS